MTFCSSSSFSAKRMKSLRKRSRCGTAQKLLTLASRLPISSCFQLKNVAPHRVPGRAVVEADRLRRGEEHLRHHDLRRLDVVSADLIDAERNPLVFGRVLTLDHQHRDAVDEKDHVLARTVAAVVEVELFRDFVDIAPLALGSSQVAIIDQRDVQLAIVFRGEKLVLVAQRRSESRDCRRCPNETAETPRPAHPRLLCTLD